MRMLARRLWISALSVALLLACGLPATTDEGDEPLGTVTAAGGFGGCTMTAHCNDSNACTVDDCVFGTCVNTVRNCNDNNACTTDTCDPVGGCGHAVKNCDDNNACTTDTCDPVEGCGHAVKNCNDNNPCTTDTCDPVMGCGFGFNTAACDDGDPQTENDRCSNGTCRGTFICVSTECMTVQPDGAGGCMVVAYKPATTPCGPAPSGACDLPDHCSGTSNACVPAVREAGIVCRDAAGPCDAAESCNGTSPTCPTDAFRPSGECRPSSAACDPAESCTGTAASCPADINTCGSGSSGSTSSSSSSGSTSSSSGSTSGSSSGGTSGGNTSTSSSGGTSGGSAGPASSSSTTSSGSMSNDASDESANDSDGGCHVGAAGGRGHDLAWLVAVAALLGTRSRRRPRARL